MNRMSKKAAIIVAHPDDEVIWCGGVILQHPDWDWTILCLSRADDQDRCPKFRAVCGLLGVTGHIADLDDGNPLKQIDCQKEISDRIANCLGTPSWDLCITHGPNGEYGHRRHIEIHAQVLELVRDLFLECDDLWTFAYEWDSRADTCRPAPDADIVVHLSDEELAEKKRIICNVYGYDCDSFEDKACISPEAFRRWETPVSGD